MDPRASKPRKFSTVQMIGAASIVVALAVMSLKYAAYLVTGSVALYSDALESIVNLVAALAALLAISFGARPADKEHPFGHHKAEYFSAVLEGALIIVAALLIFREAYDALLSPRDLEAFGFGMGLSALATVLNGAWAAFLVRRGRAHRSPALVADGWHLFTDVLTSVGVIAGLLLAKATGIALLDPLLAVAVAAYILWSGSKIAMASLSGLLDEAADADIQARIRAAIKESGHGALEAHGVRTRISGPVVFIEFHLVVPGAMSVHEAHEICDRLEAALEAEIEGSDVVIHVEPEHKAESRTTGAIQL
ncbi:cation diffusion facilitator family transporter [Hyphomicrobium sp.]|uniref:cation diffusion facilitator family transporter n=1 Tax=Hyphomicrobium sp. TaxID=82 RepID=UPI002BA72A5F|nr:cation diffusion facilitator family transporter [Hyphomicrobium sp.]HRN87327.1 cation diffusion facilitator family transporter [Hyphomicrobium sp.]HRQ26455.1 cation diffusion facilitator family transporter [Hyphomicrobium sp.]